MFAIYIPGRHRNDSAILHEVGAGWALDPSVTAMFLDVDLGPDGGGGKLVYFESRRARQPITFYSPDPTLQQWSPAAPEGDLAARRYWIGLPAGRKPSAEELQREDIIDGLPLTLADGQEWIVPIADYCPRRLKLNRETGEQETRPFDKHKLFIERTNAMFRLLISDEFQDRVREELAVQIPDGLTYASLVLEQNYRVNRDLVDLLDLIGDFEAVKIAGVATALELLAVADAQKKTPRLLAMPSSVS